MQRLVLGFMAILFSLQDLLRSVFKIRSKVPTAPPLKPDSVVVPGGRWGYFLDQYHERLFYREWLPSDGSSPWAIVIALHGMGAHGAHYWVLGQYLAEQGIATYALDLRGHGYSEGPRGDLSQSRKVVDGILAAAHFALPRYPIRPVFVLGESYGALLAMMVAAQGNGVIAGAILAGVPVQPTESASASSFLETILQYVHYAPYLFFDSRARVIDITGREARVSRDQSEVERTKTDPLRNNRQSPRTFAEVYRVTSMWSRIAKQVKVPCLLLQGGHDLVTDPNGVWKVRDKLASDDVNVVIFPEAYHGLFFDPDTPRVLEAIATWLNHHTSY
jgi:alpha-beta hydrolase superfamily lysophospholipase